jgi:hypothetical protein
MCTSDAESHALRYEGLASGCLPWYPSRRGSMASQIMLSRDTKTKNARRRMPAYSGRCLDEV